MSKNIDKPPTDRGSAEVFGAFLKLGLTSFGGPVAHLAYFRKEFVERKHWLSESQFTQLLAICQFLPGPASSQLGFAIGLLRAGWLGALAAFIAFTLPSVLLLLGFVYLLPSLTGPISIAAIHGLKLVACVVVADAVFGMSKKQCPDIRRAAIAVFAVLVLLFVATAWSQMMVIIAGALAGMLWCKGLSREPQLNSTTRIQVAYGKRTALLLFALFSVLLLGFIWLPGELGLYAVAQAFYRAGALVFGGGHVVLPLLEESVVASGWLSSEHFLAGYGAAQAIPGPMFSFAAYLGASIPLQYSIYTVAGCALLFMFLPGFILLAATLPLWQSISQHSIATKALAGINAAVVGVLAAALYDPIFTSGINSVLDMAIVTLGFVMLNRWKYSPLWVLLWCVMASMLSTLL